MDESPGVQETQSINDLEQNVQNCLCPQHWEFCTLGKKNHPKSIRFDLQVFKFDVRESYLFLFIVIGIYYGYYLLQKAAKRTNVKFIGGKG